MLTEFAARKNERLIYAAPVVIEGIILLFVGLLYPYFINSNPDAIAFSLLFAMGLQNSLVTTISNSAVRTTHLTGLFTDLGIELSQLFFYRSLQHKKELRSSIKLRFTIISFFFLGGISGGLLYSIMNLHLLVVASILLVVGLVYDNIKFRVILLKCRLRTLEPDDINS